MKYIDAEKLKRLVGELKERAKRNHYDSWGIVPDALEEVEEFITSLQQDETQVDKMLCSQVWWEEQGWIMIPPDATIEGIDSLLRQVKKKLQQEQPGLPGIEEPGIPGKDYIPVDWVDACEMYGKWKIVKQEQPEVDLENEFADFLEKENAYVDDNGVISYYNGGSFNHTCDIYPIARHFYELGLKARKV